MNHKNNNLYRRFVYSLSYCKRPDNRLRSFRVPTKTGTCTLKICDYYEIFRD